MHLVMFLGIPHLFSYVISYTGVVYTGDKMIDSHGITIFSHSFIGSCIMQATIP